MSGTQKEQRQLLSPSALYTHKISITAEMPIWTNDCKTCKTYIGDSATLLIVSVMVQKQSWTPVKSIVREVKVFHCPYRRILPLNPFHLLFQGICGILKALGQLILPLKPFHAVVLILQKKKKKIQRTSKRLNASKLPVYQQFRPEYPMEPHILKFAPAIKYLVFQGPSYFFVFFFQPLVLLVLEQFIMAQNEATASFF